jgi:hypothetical protein
MLTKRRTPSPGLHERVRGDRRDDDDLASDRSHRGALDGEGGPALVEHERLLVGVPVQAGAGARRKPHDEERHAGAVLVPLEARGDLPAGKVAERQRRRDHVDRASSSIAAE